MRLSSAVAAVRPGLEKTKELLRAGDTLVVWRLDRLGRSLQDVIAWTAWLAENGVALQSLQEVIELLPKNRTVTESTI